MHVCMYYLQLEESWVVFLVSPMQWEVVREVVFLVSHYSYQLNYWFLFVMLIFRSLVDLVTRSAGDGIGRFRFHSQWYNKAVKSFISLILLILTVF